MTKIEEFFRGAIESCSWGGPACAPSNRELRSITHYVRSARHKTLVVTLKDGSRWECQDRGAGAAEWVAVEL